MKLRPVVGLYGILEATEEGGEASSRLLSAVAERLRAEGMDVKPSPEIVGNDETALKTARYFQSVELDLLVAVVITWSFDSLHVTILKRVNLPLAIIAVPGIRAGSIVGAHQLGSLLHDLKKEHAIFYGPEQDPATYKPVAAYALAAAARRKLDLGKLGYIGRRTPGMTPIAFDEVEIARRFGPLMELFGWEEIEDFAKAVPKGDVSALMGRIKAGAGGMDSSEASLEYSVRLTVALRDLARRNRILAYGIGCYPHYAGKACLAVGMLTDEGIPAGCEGDLNAALVMYLLQSFTGQPAHFGEILEVNEEQNTLITSHCGCGAPSLAARPAAIRLTPVRLFDRGIAIRYPSKAFPETTFVNLTGRTGTYRMCAVGGSAIETAMVFEGNPVAFRAKVPVRRLLDRIAEQGFGHHWMMGYGDALLPLKSFCRMTGTEVVMPDEG